MSALDFGNQKLSAGQIQSIYPFPLLDDLSAEQSDIDNDIQILLDWLQPVIPQYMAVAQAQDVPLAKPRHLRQTRSSTQQPKFETIDPKFSLSKYKEPSHRIKSAIKSCLKNEEDHLKLMNVYINSVNAQLHQYHKPMEKEFTFIDFINFIKLLNHHYESQIDHLNLPSTVRRLFNNRFHISLTSYLFEKTDFVAHLTQFFQSNLFFKSTLSKPISPTMTLNIIDIISTLVTIGMSDKLNEIVVELSISRIKDFTIQLSSGIWNRPLLEAINSFIQNEIYPNFSIVVSYTTESNLTDTMNHIYLYELMKLAHGELISQRVQEIYFLVSAYPNSEIALKELHTCLSKFKLDQNSLKSNSSSSTTTTTASSFLPFYNYYSPESQNEQRGQLVDHFIDECRKHLLHAGVNTVDVMITYTRTIKSFLLIDPKGVLLDKVVRPIRNYLKSRSDIFTKLVHGLLDTSEDNKLRDLAEQLYNSKKKDSSSSSTHAKKKMYVNKNANEDCHDLNWTPDPIDALPDFKKEKVTDIIESLISIFDSKEIFIQEFTNLFASQMIDARDFDVSDVEAKLNLLKSRFGKNSFTTLDVMIKDFKVSREINGAAAIQFGILSHLYWSSVLDGNTENNNDFKWPKLMDDIFKRFQDKNSMEKPGRTLKLVPSLGRVTIRLELKSGNREFQVSPEKAAIISMFNEEDNELSVEYISTMLKMPSYMVNEGLKYWVKEGILLALTPTLFIVDDDDDDTF